MTMPANKLARPALILLAAVALCACDGKVTIDLAVTGNDAVGSVVLPPSAVRFQQSGGTINTVTIDEGTTADLNALAPNQRTTLFSGEKLAGSDYNALALDFNSIDATITLNDGTDASVSLSTSSAFAPMSLNIKKNNETFTRVVVLDLRFSLTRTAGSVEVVPYYRVVDPADEGTVSGIVDDTLVEATACENSRDPGQGVAVYAYAGHDATPQDFLIGSDTNPVASAQVALNSASSSYKYTLPFLASGDYTLALTCNGDTEDPQAAQTLGFSGAQNISISAGATTTADFD